MRTSFATAVAAGVGLIPAQSAFGQTDDKKLGKVHFETSCNPEAQKLFNRGMLYQHSFWYRASQKEFEDVLKADPECGIAYWGIALSLLWNPHVPTPAKNLTDGAAAIAKAKAIGAKTQRERDYVDALSAMYADFDKVDRGARMQTYTKAMEELAQRYPKDDEAQIHYALALNTSASSADKTYANQLKGAAILEPIARRQPRHPGVALLHLRLRFVDRFLVQQFGDELELQPFHPKLIRSRLVRGPFRLRAIRPVTFAGREIEILRQLLEDPGDAFLDPRLVNVEDVVGRVDVTKERDIVVNVLPVLGHELGAIRAEEKEPLAVQFAHVIGNHARVVGAADGVMIVVQLVQYLGEHAGFAFQDLGRGERLSIGGGGRTRTCDQVDRGRSRLDRQLRDDDSAGGNKQRKERGQPESAEYSKCTNHGRC
jgi:hypothetical protein